MAKRVLGVGGVLGAVVTAALGTVVGCGDGFASSDDCHASRTCSSTAGETAAGGNGAGGADDMTPGGMAGTAGAAGAAGAADLGGAGGAEAECAVDADCSNHKAEDGAELCDAGVCVAGNAPPTIVSFTPEEDAVDVEPDTTIVIEFSEPLDGKTVTPANIRVQDGTTVLAGTLTPMDGKVTFTPATPLSLLASYTLSVTTGVKDVDGAALLEPLSVTFAIRDGAWREAIDIAKDTRGTLSDVLPMNSDGSALVAWTGREDSYCPAWGRWFLRGVGSDAAKSLAIAGQTECNIVSAGGNAEGVSAVTWSEPDAANGNAVAQFRDGAWLGKPQLVAKGASSDRLRVAVAPDGSISLFEHATASSTVWTTDAAGAWPDEADVISDLTPQGRTSVAFDATGNGLAVWRAKDKNSTKQRIASSRLTAGGKWAEAVDLPGSVAATLGDAQRGVPIVAFDSKGDAIALWVDASSSKLKASRFSKTGWAQPEIISGALTVDLINEAPALTFDGQAFVAAWVALDDGNRYTYSARYDLTTGWAPHQKRQGASPDGTSANRMPRLASDGRGNLILVFAKGAGAAFTLVYERYSNQEWSGLTDVPGGSVTNINFETQDILPLSMSANGLAVLAWSNYDTIKYASTVRLASFY